MVRLLPARISLLLGLFMVLALPAVGAAPIVVPKLRPLDYSKPEAWVCRPGACRDDLSATVLARDGSTRIETFRKATRPLVDCFYVYPTVSHSRGILADPIVTSDERRAVIQQAERFTSLCRLFAPLYRQVTVTSMQQRVLPRPSQAEALEAARRAQADVLDAWDYYMAQDNRGRGVVLIGHSQGAGILINLIRQRLDGAANQNQLVSAVLAGAGVMVPEQGRETGITFKAIPPCRSDGQIGCVISFNMVRAARPIPAEAIQRSAGVRQVCTNPAALGGGSGYLKPYLSSKGETIIPELSAPQPAWSKAPLALRTPFMTTPELYSAECAGGGAYVAVSIAARSGDRRTGALTGDWIQDGKPEPTMGLHLVDLNLAAGNLVDILRRQAAVYASAHPRSHVARR